MQVKLTNIFNIVILFKAWFCYFQRMAEADVTIFFSFKMAANDIDFTQHSPRSPD
jgi:hypothetical protein